MDLKDYLAAQSAVLLRAISDPFATGFSAAADLSALAQRVGDNSGTVKPVGRIGSANAVTVINKHGDPELWCRASSYQGYDPAFAAFAKAEYGFIYDKAKYPDYDVDHLFNRGRVYKRGEAPAPGPDGIDHKLPSTAMVRMVLVRSDVNRSFGSMTEKMLGGKNRGDRPWRDFTSMQLAKGLGIHPNVTGGGLADTANLIHIVAEMKRLDVLTALGVGEAGLLAELISQRDFAARKTGP